MEPIGDRKGWIDLGVGFIMGIAAVGVAVAGLNYGSGWQRVGAWERALETRHSEHLERLMLGQIEEIKMGPPTDFRNFMCAVIDEAYGGTGVGFVASVLMATEVARVSASWNVIR